jgi:hypothetical protein
MTPDKAAMTIQKLRTKFPLAAPCDPEGGPTGSYCVGGVLVRGLLSGWSQLWYDCVGYPNESKYNYPEPNTLADTLIGWNNHLDETTANFFASEIINNNDTGSLGKAWAAAEEALGYPYTQTLRASSPELKHDEQQADAGCG